MDKLTGPAVGGTLTLPCGWCYARLPKEELHSLEGDLLCSPCFEQVRKKRDREADGETSVERKATKELTIRDVPKGHSSFAPKDNDLDRVRDRLIQLEHQKRRRPKDVDLLSEMADLYDELGDDEQASTCRREMLELDPSHPGLRGKVIADGPKLSPRPSTATPFWEDIPEILAFPLRGRGLSMVIVGGILFGITLWIARYSIFGWILTGGIFGFLWAYWFSVISSAAAGVKEPPDWPEFFDVWHSILWPAIAAIICAAIPFGPALGLFLAIVAGPLTFNIITIPLLALLGLGGVFTYPMVLMVYSMFNTISAASGYRFVYGSIAKILPDYILCIAAYCVLGTMSLVASVTITAGAAFFLPIPILGSLTVSVLTATTLLYFNIAAYRLLGHLYHQSQGRLGWFEEKTEPEKNLNLFVVLAGVLGLGVASAAGLLAVLFLPGLMLNASGVSDLPFQDGTFLEYSEFDSNYGWASVRYEIEEVSEGFRISGGIESNRIRNDFPDFTVNARGEFVGGITDVRSGPIFSVRPGLSAREQTIFLGPAGGWLGSPHINGYIISGRGTWKGWDVFKVDDKDAATTLMYDTSTGYLVGVDATGIGRDLWVVLTSTNVDGLQVPPEAHEGN